MDLAELQACFPGGVWLIDTEYATPVGDPVIPVCLVATEFFSGRRIQQFFDPTQTYENPLSIGKDSLFIAYAAQAEWSCFLSLGWDVPIYVIDLHAEFRNEISGRTPPIGRDSFDPRLIGAMDYYGLDRISAVEKKEMQERISRGHPFTSEEQQAILDYCESDVVCLEKLFPAMAPSIELPYAIFRGRYSKAVARMERPGIPIDRESYERLIRNRECLKSRLIAEFERKYGRSPYATNLRGVHVFSFRELEMYIEKLGLLSAWQKTPKRRLKTSEDYLQEMARRHPALGPLANLVKRIGDLRKFELTIGSDDRARYSVMPFKSETGRNQPKARQFLFAQSSWTRGFIKAAPGHAVAHLDWNAAEFAIAAALASDPVMLEAYKSGDPYLRSAINMGFAPEGATKETHGTIRDIFKVWLLSAQYGATAESLVNKLPHELATNLPNPLASAEEFLDKHRRLHRVYWQWAEARVEIFMHETRCEETLFGWRHRLNARLKDWQIRNQSLNFPMQSTCAELLRWNCIYTTECGIEVLAPVHDALLVGCLADEVEEVVSRTRDCMDRASILVLGFAMRTDVKIFKYPDRFIDPRGAETWKTIMQLLDEIEEDTTDDDEALCQE
jgi:DNA polymerase I-like protein with 3'-5' exonuclease and polymerase domains